jgi:hypothetical protein
VFSSGGPTWSLLLPASAPLWSAEALPVELAAGWPGLPAELLELAVELLLPAGLLELLVGGGELVGGDDSDFVGLLAVGQPDNSRHRQAVPPMP